MPNTFILTANEREKVIELDHPVIGHLTNEMRNLNSDSLVFRKNTRKIAEILVYEATRKLQTCKIMTTTPLFKMDTAEYLTTKITIVSILRAANLGAESMMDFLPNANMGHVGLARNEETLEPEEYLWKMPTDVKNRDVIIFDPMLATGNSFIHTIAKLKKIGVEKITITAIFAAPEGIKQIREAFDDIPIVVSVVDSHLNEKGYIVPGCGDAGDRMYGTT